MPALLFIQHKVLQCNNNLTYCIVNGDSSVGNKILHKYKMLAGR